MIDISPELLKTLGALGSTTLIFIIWWYDRKDKLEAYRQLFDILNRTTDVLIDLKQDQRK